jgi:hypothetical protein
MVVIGKRQWHRVVDVIRAIEDDRLIVQGAAMYLNGQLILMATAVKSVYVERQRQEAQWAVSQGGGELNQSCPKKESYA